MAKLSIKKDDYVKIIAGKDKGKTAQVLSIDTKNNRATVEGKGVSPIKKSIKARKASDKSGIIDMPSTINVSNLMPLCAACNKPTRVGYKIVDGKKVRVCKKCGQTLETKKIVEKKAKATVTKRVKKVDNVEAVQEKSDTNVEIAATKKTTATATKKTTATATKKAPATATATKKTTATATKKAPSTATAAKKTTATATKKADETKNKVVAEEKKVEKNEAAAAVETVAEAKKEIKE